MFPSVFQQIPLLRAYTASREAFVSCSPPHPSVTSSLGLQPPSCEKPSLQLLWKIIWRLLLLVLVEKAKSWSLSTHDTVNFYHIFSKSLLICLAKKKKKKIIAKAAVPYLEHCDCTPSFFVLLYPFWDVGTQCCTLDFHGIYKPQTYSNLFFLVCCLFFSWHWILLDLTYFHELPNTSVLLLSQESLVLNGKLVCLSPTRHSFLRSFKQT